VGLLETDLEPVSCFQRKEDIVARVDGRESRPRVEPGHTCMYLGRVGRLVVLLWLGGVVTILLVLTGVRGEWVLGAGLFLLGLGHYRG
jgi:hypothetical protein